MLAQRPVLLVVDFTDRPVESDWIEKAREFCSVHPISPNRDLHASIKLVGPQVLVFEFGHCDPAGLAMLAHTKQAFPSLPILIVTDEHSEALAVWALRTRVWDYFVKPFSVEDFQWAVTNLAILLADSKSCSARRMTRPRGVEQGVRAGDAPRAERAVIKARAYVDSHLGERISETVIADLCAMSYFHFSRTFRRLTGMTFREYVLRARIRRAAELLAMGSASVTTICYEAGFRDASQFARHFRRYMHCSPSEYARSRQPGGVPTPAPQPLHLERRVANTWANS